MNFSGKRILITGHTGFKGTWISHLLSHFDPELFGISLPSNIQDSFPERDVRPNIKEYFLDIRDLNSITQVIGIIKPEIVIHMAAQPLVLNSYEMPLETYQTNVMGTANILEALKNTGCTSSVIVVTTDKVYLNSESSVGYCEDDPLGGLDPYSGSKSATELVVNSWRESVKNIGKLNFVTVRSGNVIGGGDKAENRIIPDLIRAFKSGESIRVRNPNSIRPWQHVLDTLYGYLLVADKLQSEVATHDSYNFGPGEESRITVLELAKLFSSQWPGGGEIEANFAPVEGRKETEVLWLNSERARNDLGWSPILDIEKSIGWIVEWESTLHDMSTFEKLHFQTKQYLEKVPR
jgi:CDP-glucose 4,6-dehydratase